MVDWDFVAGVVSDCVAAVADKLRLSELRLDASAVEVWYLHVM